MGLLSLSLFFYLLDFFIYSFFETTAFHILLLYFIVALVFDPQVDGWIYGYRFAFLLLLVEGAFIYGRVLYCLIYLPPLIFLANKGKKLLNFQYPLVVGLVIIAVFAENFIVKRLILGHFLSLYSTMTTIFINVILMTFMFRIKTLLGT